MRSRLVPGARPPHLAAVSTNCETLWYVSPRHNRPSILANGLRPSDVDQRHVWLFASREVALRQMCKVWGGDRHPDLWEVDASGYEVLPDPHAGWADPDHNSASRVVLRPIPPERCRLSAATP
jgi:hypothetical protein